MKTSPPKKSHGGQREGSGPSPEDLRTGDASQLARMQCTHQGMARVLKISKRQFVDRAKFNALQRPEMELRAFRRPNQISWPAAQTEAMLRVLRMSRSDRH